MPAVTRAAPWGKNAGHCRYLQKWTMRAAKEARRTEAALRHDLEAKRRPFFDVLQLARITRDLTHYVACGDETGFGALRHGRAAVRQGQGIPLDPETHRAGIYHLLRIRLYSRFNGQLEVDLLSPGAGARLAWKRGEQRLRCRRVPQFNCNSASGPSNPDSCHGVSMCRG